jgi:gliding motility-associated-like protein
LGNTSGGGQAEGISYQFTIPANENAYSLIYHYAVVFQAPDHRENEQPRMEIEVLNVTDNLVIECASFTFISIGSSLPGFETAGQSDSAEVLYKDWSAVSVDLSGHAGKTIRLFFKTGDCTFRRHFGYAYIDVNTECSNSFLGAAYCRDDSVVNVTAPHGYQNYTWYDSTLTNILGTQQILTLSPASLSGTTVAVKLDPYNGYGCPKTLFALLLDTLTVTAVAGEDRLSCNLNPVPIGTIPKPGLVYAWTPVAGLSNPEIANPLAAPDITTTYLVTTRNSGGGCRSTDMVIVRSSIIDNSLQLLGKASFCIDNGDSAVLKVQPTNSINWLRNDRPITGALQAMHKVTSSGTYYAQLINAAGCSLTTKKQVIVIDKAKRGISYPEIYAVINLPITLKARQIGENILWNPATNLNTPTIFAPIFKGTLEQQYTIAIRTNTECLTIDTQLVKIVKHVEIYVPTAFTPNKDGRNDFLHPIIRGSKAINYFKIFNRWGQLLFERREGQPGWDGNFKGTPQQTQVVVWILEFVGVDGVVYVQKGTSALLR